MATREFGERMRNMRTKSEENEQVKQSKGHNNGEAKFGNNKESIPSVVQPRVCGEHQR